MKISENLAKLIELGQQYGCPDLSAMGAYASALARLTEFTGILQATGFRHSKDRA